MRVLEAARENYQLQQPQRQQLSQLPPQDQASPQDQAPPQDQGPIQDQAPPPPPQPHEEDIREKLSALQGFRENNVRGRGRGRWIGQGRGWRIWRGRRPSRRGRGGFSGGDVLYLF